MDIMIDIETLGLKPDTTILSIGAVEFDKTSFGEEFYRELVPAQPGRSIDPDTVLWWLNQDGSAFLKKNKATLHDALHDLIDFCTGLDGSVPRIWANAPVFDLAILRHAYEQAGLQCPWMFYHERDIRTIKAFIDKEDYPLFAGTKHNALDDAMFQARLAQTFLDETGTTL